MTQISVGARHAVVLTSGGKVFTWGFGGYSRLGQRDTRDRHAPQVRLCLFCIVAVGFVRSGGDGGGVKKVFCD